MAGRLRVAYDVQDCGKMGVFHNFRQLDEPAPGMLLPHAGIQVAASHHPDEAHTLSDGIFTHQWRSRAAQEEGMWIELALPAETHLERIRFYYNGYPHDHANALHILSRTNGDAEWTPVITNLPWRIEGIDFRNGHPVYYNQFQEVPLDGLRAGALRIEIAEVSPGRDWTIGEIELYAQDGP
jgi:hypothetical protein